MIDQVNATYNHELVKRMIEEAVLAEREACAAICDELHESRVGKDNYFAFAANAIRELRAKQ
jgi:hypothetical protein